MSVGLWVTALIALASLLVATFQAWMLQRSERLRTQPIVLVGEEASPSKRVDGTAVVELFLRNDGAGSALHIEFGIVEGTKLHPVSPAGSGPGGPGNLRRVLAAGGRAPDPPGTFTYEIPFDVFPRGKLVDRVYWCRFQNAFGHTWETRNSSAPDTPLEIARRTAIRKGEPIYRPARD